MWHYCRLQNGIIIIDTILCLTQAHKLLEFAVFKYTGNDKAFKPLKLSMFKFQWGSHYVICIGWLTMGPTVSKVFRSEKMSQSLQRLYHIIRTGGLILSI